MTAELASGQVLLGRYRLDRRLDEGGMSVVWAGTHLVTGKQVALKLLKGESAGDEAVRRRMLREARAACAVVHPNVVQIHDVLELDDGSPVLVMDLLTGESLRDRLLRRKALPVDETATLLLPVVAGVGTAHAAGVIHRDLKPENIFLAQEAGDLRVKVLDFGIAKLVASANNISQVNALTNTGTMLGTPYYMAPEQMLGEPVDHRADVWSIGVILYECLAGERPTEAENIGKILKRVLTNEIEPLSARAPHLPADVTGLVDRMLSQSAAARPSSLHEVSEVLARYAHGVAAVSFGAPNTRPEPQDGGADGRTSRPSGPARGSRPSGPARRSRPSGPDDAPETRRSGPDADVDASLAETLMAPRPEDPRTAVPADTAPAVTAARSADPRPGEAPASSPGAGRRRAGAVAAAVAGVLALGGAAAYLSWPKGRERPYVPASAAVGVPAGRSCPEGMGYVPGGVYKIGSDEGKDDERPVHEVKIEPFCMDVTEVTAGAYHECVQKGACRPAESTVKWMGLADDVRERESAACVVHEPGTGALPMNCVSWDDAEAYCRAVGKRLPTEPEWEVAAGGGAERRRFPWGPQPPSPRLLNACDRSCAEALEKLGSGKQRPMFEDDDGAKGLAPVGTYPDGASRFGMHDMAGNVWEWTASPYCTYPEHACASQYRVFRGGGWAGTLVSNVRVTARMWSLPGHRYNDVGFRCVNGL